MQSAKHRRSDGAGIRLPSPPAALQESHRKTVSAGGGGRGGGGGGGGGGGSVWVEAFPPHPRPLSPRPSFSRMARSGCRAGGEGRAEAGRRKERNAAHAGANHYSGHGDWAIVSAEVD